MQKMSLSAAVAAVAIAGGGQVWAANVDFGTPSPVSVPGIAAGQPARASDVTGAFGAVQSAVNDNFALINTLQQQVNNLPTGTCPSDMVDVGQFCIDTYEASVSGGNTDLVAAGCAADGAGCAAAGLTVASVAGATPQQNVSWFQALQLCKLAGKRLPSNAEWQLAATGTDVNAGGTAGTAGPGCNASGSAFLPTGNDFDSDPATNCRSDAGAFDMVGNVREWVSDYTSNTTATDMRTINAVTRGGGSGGAGFGEYTMAEQAANDNTAAVFGFRCAKDK